MDVFKSLDYRQLSLAFKSANCYCVIHQSFHQIFATRTKKSYQDDPKRHTEWAYGRNYLACPWSFTIKILKTYPWWLDAKTTSFLSVWTAFHKYFFDSVHLPTFKIRSMLSNTKKWFYGSYPIVRSLSRGWPIVSI